MYEVLNEGKVATLATIGRDGSPHLSAIYYTCSSSFVIGFGTKSETTKVRNIERDNRVEILVFDEVSQTTIRLKGTAHRVRDESVIQPIVENMYWSTEDEEYHSPPISKLAAGDVVIYQIKPINASMAIFTRPQRGGYDMFEQLEFDQS